MTVKSPLNLVVVAVIVIVPLVELDILSPFPNVITLPETSKSPDTLTCEFEINNSSVPSIFRVILSSALKFR